MVGTVNLDLLPLKRVYSIDEAASEHLPPEHTSEEKLRLLLQRVDFEHSEEKESKKSKSQKEAASQASSKWPWQGLVENLQMAQQELSYILDFITHIEANDAITVANMQKPKQLLHEACSEFALRAASKLHSFKKIGKHLKQTARALEQQVDREAVFYGALMRLQQHWKIKRLRGISAGPGGNAGFSIDLTYPQMPTEMMTSLSMRSAGLCSVNIEQDPTGLLIADVPGHSLGTIDIHFIGPYIPHNHALEERPATTFSTAIRDGTNIGIKRSPHERDVAEAVSKGATTAHSMLRHIQMAVIEEQTFEWTVREGLLSSTGLVITGVNENRVQLSLGNSCALVIELSRMKKIQAHSKVLEAAISDGLHEVVSHAESNCKMPEHGQRLKDTHPKFLAEMSAIVCLQQAFCSSAFSSSKIQESSQPSLSKTGQSRSADGALVLSKFKDSLRSVTQDHLSVEAVMPLKKFALIMRHKVLSLRVQSELDKLVSGVPYLFLFFHPTWNARLTAWMLKLEIPQPVVQGWKMNLIAWNDAKKKSGSKYYLKVLLYDASLHVEGTELMHLRESTVSSACQQSKQRCDSSDLPGFLLYKLAGQLVKWLFEEALVMGLRAKRNLLSIFFHINSNDDCVLVAAVDAQAYCINWWLQVGADEEDGQKEEMPSGKSRKFLGPISLEILRGILLDLLDLCNDDS